MLAVSERISLIKTCCSVKPVLNKKPNPSQFVSRCKITLKLINYYIRYRMYIYPLKMVVCVRFC